MGFVNELLEGEAYVQMVPIPGVYGLGASFGDTKMSSSSWPKLKKRLLDNGFIIKSHPWEDGNRRKIEMRFSG
jgi:hypothetical protein